MRFQQSLGQATMKLLHNQYHVICTKPDMKKEALPFFSLPLSSYALHRMLFYDTGHCSCYLKPRNLADFRKFGISISQFTRASTFHLVEIIPFWQYCSLSFTIWKDTNESLHTGLAVDRGKVIMQTQGPELLMKVWECVEDNRVVK